MQAGGWGASHGSSPTPQQMAEDRTWEQSVQHNTVGFLTANCCFPRDCIHQCIYYLYISMTRSPSQGMAQGILGVGSTNAFTIYLCIWRLLPLKECLQQKASTRLSPHTVPYPVSYSGLSLSLNLPSTLSIKLSVRPQGRINIIVHTDVHTNEVSTSAGGVIKWERRTLFYTEGVRDLSTPQPTYLTAGNVVNVRTYLRHVETHNEIER